MIYINQMGYIVHMCEGIRRTWAEAFEKQHGDKEIRSFPKYQTGRQKKMQMCSSRPMHVRLYFILFVFSNSEGQ